MKNLLRIEQIIVKIEEASIISLLAALVFLQLTQVLFRYFLNNPLHWVDELSRYLFIWMIMIGAGYAAYKATHFNIEFFRGAMPLPLQRLFEVFSKATIGAFALIVIIYGSRLLVTVSNQMTAALRIPFSIPYGAVPAGSILVLFHVLLTFVPFEKE